MMKAGIAAAIGLTLLVPTFNALNLSYVENVTPPPWMPPPKDPPNITPPTNFQPPPDFEPPEGYEGEIPPGACPPPLIVPIEDASGTHAVTGPSATSWTKPLKFELPEGVFAFGGFANFTQWQGRSVAVTITGPDGFETWRDSDVGEAFLLQPRPDDTSFAYNSTEGDNPSTPPPGEYTLELRVETPISGRVETKFVMALACGGMMSP